MNFQGSTFVFLICLENHICACKINVAQAPGLNIVGGGVGAERRTRGEEKLPTLAVGWRSSAERGEEAVRFCEVTGVVHRCCGRSAFRGSHFQL